MRPPPRRPSGPGPLSWLFILIVLGVALVLPLLGAWVASTLAIHHGAPRELAMAAGLALALVLPVAWEVSALPRRRADGSRPPRRLRLKTRLLLRTWALNLVFLAAALLLSPRGVFTALSTRGDWMLPPRGGASVEMTRRLLFAAADGVEWAYELATDNPYRDQLIAIAPRPTPPVAPAPLPPAPVETPAAPPPVPEVAPTPEVAPLPAVSPTPETAPAPDESQPLPPPPTSPEREDDPLASDSDVVLSWKTEPQPPEPVAPDTAPKPTKKPSGMRYVQVQKQTEPLAVGDRVPYPLPAQLHPRVASLPKSVETDPVSVAKYLVSGESDPFQRVKALHDYIADRVAYDVVAYRTKKRPPQTPEEVFRSRKAVCAGYSNLFAEMGNAVGEEVVTLPGEALYLIDDGEEHAHAWNAVRIRGEWYLVDVTWNAGYVNGDTFTKGYRTDFLFMPPQKFLERHFPDDPAWQLLDRPLSRGEALRNLQMNSTQVVERSLVVTPSPESSRAAAAAAIRIREPSRPRAEVKGRFHVELDNPEQLPAQVSLLNTQNGSLETCHPEYGGARYACTALDRGLYRIQVLAGPRDTSPRLVAQLEVTGL